MPVMQEDQASSRVADHAEMLALSLPSFVFSGYELARKTYLPVLLVGAAGLNVAKAGLILTIVGGWGIVVEVLFGMVCDLAPDPHRRRSFWVMTGMALQGVGGLILWLMPQNRTVLGWLLGLLPWASGWVLSNLAHGAWALERSSGVPARGRIFGARAQAGMAGSILFAAALLWSRHDHHGMDDFHVLLWLTLAGSPLVHGWLIWRVKERPTMVPSKPDWRSALKPFRAGRSETPEKVALYRGHRSSLEGRVMFINTDEQSPAAAYLTLNRPVEDAERIARDVKAGFLVRTRADEGTWQARNNDTAHRDTALHSGAQEVSTDYLWADPRFPGGFSVGLPGHAASLCNTMRTGNRCGGLPVEVTGRKDRAAAQAAPIVWPARRDPAPGLSAP